MQHSGPAVAGGAAAKTQPNLLTVIFKSVRDQFACAVGGGQKGIELILAKEAKSAGRGGFDDSGPSDDSVSRFDGTPERIVAGNRPE